MKVLQKVRAVKRSDFIREHLRIVSSMMPEALTGAELRVLAAFMGLEGPEFEADRFSSVGRKIVQAQLGLPQSSVSNYLKWLEAKGYVQRTEVLRRRYIPGFLFPGEGAQGYQFRLEVEHGEASGEGEE